MLPPGCHVSSPLWYLPDGSGGQPCLAGRNLAGGASSEGTRPDLTGRARPQVVLVNTPPRRPRHPAVVVGPRLRAQVPRWSRARSAVLLAILSVLIGTAVAAALASAIGFAVQALLHAFGTGP